MTSFMKQLYRNGRVTKDDYIGVLRAYLVYVDAVKRDVAAAVRNDYCYYMYTDRSTHNVIGMPKRITELRST